MYFYKTYLFKVLAIILLLSSCKKDAPVLLESDQRYFVLAKEEETSGIASAITPEGDYVTVCTKIIAGNKKEIILFKTNQFLKLIWEKTLSTSLNQSAADIHISNSGEIYILGNTIAAGSSEADILILKTDASGNIIWNRNYGGAREEYARKIIGSNDGNFLITGLTQSFGKGSDDAYLLKIDAFGNIIWQETYGGASFDGGMDVLETSDGNILMLCFTDNFGAGDRDFWLLKLNSRGIVIWNKLYGGEQYEEPQALIQTSDGNFVLAGHSASFVDLNHDAYAVKVDQEGNIIWEKTYGSNGIHDGAEAAAANSNGGAYLVVRTNHHHSTNNFDSENALIIKIDNNGKVISEKHFGGSMNDRFQHILINKNESVLLSGFTISNTASSLGKSNPWLLKNP
jgi:hypothetical protein